MCRGNVPSSPKLFPHMLFVPEVCDLAQLERLDTGLVLQPFCGVSAPSSGLCSLSPPGAHLPTGAGKHSPGLIVWLGRWGWSTAGRGFQIFLAPHLCSPSTLGDWGLVLRALPGAPVCSFPRDPITWHLPIWILLGSVIISIGWILWVLSHPQAQCVPAWVRMCVYYCECVSVNVLYKCDVCTCMSIWVYMHVEIWVCAQVCMCVFVWMNVSMRVSLSAWGWAYAWVISVHKWLFLYMSVCDCVRECPWVYVSLWTLTCGPCG